MVERRLQISLALTTVLATMLLGLAQRNPTVAIIGVFAGVTSVLFTDIYKWIVLDRRISYVAMIAAAAISLNGFWDNSSEAQLLSIANMLIFVQIALLYQQKTVRVYSHLAVFSVLQVVVAALLGVDAMFALFLTGYVVSGSYAVMLFSMHRESIRLERLQEPDPQFSLFGAMIGGRELKAERLPEWTRVRGERVICQAARGHRDSAADILRFARVEHLIGLAVATLAFALTFFYASPRLVEGDWSPNVGSIGKVGFAPEITFRSLHRMIESNERVMRVKFFDTKKKQTYPLFGDPYFRGPTLSDYSFGAVAPSWRASDSTNFSWKPLPRAAELGADVELVRQEIWLNPSHRDQLFGVPAFYRDEAEAKDWLNIDFRTNTLKVNSLDSLPSTQIRHYSMLTTGMQASSQANITPQNQGGSRRNWQREFQRQLVYFDETACPTIKKVATEILESEGEDKGRIYQAQVLMRHLMTDEYEYTLETSRIRAKRNLNVDPVEDFFANHKMGFCAHFASALTLMLRSQGIPARMVVGYHGGDYNEMGEYYVIRSKHAHAWVEVYLTADDIEGISDVGNRDLGSAAGAWLRLDPTPSGSSEEFDKGMMAYVDQVLDYSRSLWSDYVLGMRRNPNAEATQATASASRDRENDRSLREWFASFIPESLRSMMGTVPIVVLLAMACWAAARQFRIMPRRGGRRRAATYRTSPIAFYNQLERAAAKHKLQRSPDQTPREFARQISVYLENLEHEPEDLGALDRIMEAFYETRFGGRPLDSQETEAIEQALRRVERALSSSPIPAG